MTNPKGYGGAVPVAQSPSGLPSDGGAEVRDAGTLVRTLAPVLGRHAARLATELDNSADNLAAARAAGPEPDGGEPMLVRAAWQPDPVAFLVQSVVDGHPLDPWLSTVEREIPARPLPALRTLALVDDPRHHIKTAGDIQCGTYGLPRLDPQWTRSVVADDGRTAGASRARGRCLVPTSVSSSRKPCRSRR